ncbi:MAG: HAD family hydrolase [Candidatus Krumholzibacteriia bacterium]
MSLWLPPDAGANGRDVPLSAPARAAATPGASRPPALFLDRDGCLMVDRNYLADPDRVEVLPGVPQALRRARRSGYLLVGLSNQSGVGRGFFTLADLDAVMARFHRLLAAEGAALDAYLYCPHAPTDRCRCRKPGPGLLEEASRRLSWDPAGSWVVGDKLSDVDLGLSAGMGAILVRTGHGAEQEQGLGERLGQPRLLVADDFPAAVAAILEREPT